MKMNLQFFAPAPDTIDINLNENKTTQLATKHKYVAKNIAVNVQDVFTYNQPQSITKISSTQQKGLRYNIKGTNNYGDDGYIEFCNGSTYEQQKGTGCGTSLKFYLGSDIGDDAAVDIYDANNKLAAVFYNGRLDNVKEKTVDLNLAGGNQTVQDGYYQYQESPVDVPGDINYYFSKVIINKPATLLPANIKKDVNIAGIVGTLEEGETLPAYTGLLRFTSAPTISLSNSTLTITAVDNATSYAIYSNNALLTTITTTSVDLSTLITTAGTYTIYAIAKATGYVDSEKSNEVSYTREAVGHKLTFSEGVKPNGQLLSSGLEVKVNGNTVTSPYTLQNGDVITATIDSNIFEINGTLYYSAETLTLSNQDINIVTANELSMGFTMTINYTETSASGYSVSCSSYANKIDTALKTYYSTNNGSTWTEFTNTGILSNKTNQIKFRMTYPSSGASAPTITPPTISSVKLGMNISHDLSLGGFDITSDNYTLTQNIDDIQYTES